MRLVELGASKLDPKTKTLFVQCKGAAVGDGSAPDYGQAPMMCALGLISMPAPANENGAAQGLLDEDLLGSDGAVASAWDIRMAEVVGKMKPGDTVLTTVGEEHEACIHLKDAERQVAHISKDSQGRTMMCLMDGKNDKYQVAICGAMIEVDPKGNIALTSASGNGIVIDESGVHVVGQLTGGSPVPGLSVALCTPAGYPLGGIVASRTAFFG